MPEEPYNPEKPIGEKIREIIEKTHPKEGVVKVSRVGKRYKIQRDHDYWKDFEEEVATDGAGTKGSIHNQQKTFSYAAQDAVAMTLDDLIEYNFEPRFLQAHIMLQKDDDEAKLQLVNGITNLCLANTWEDSRGRKYPVIYTGGETAVLNTLQGLEVGITAVGYAKPQDILIPHAYPGLELLGIASSGFHSNGYTLLREIFPVSRWDQPAPWNTNRTIGEELTIPTTIYLDTLKEILKDYRPHIKGLVHVTGGGLTKLKELSPFYHDVNMEIERYSSFKKNPDRPEFNEDVMPMFQWVYENYMKTKYPENADKLMCRWLNNGLGYVVMTTPDYSDQITNSITRSLGQAWLATTIGKITEGTGKIKINSIYSDKVVEFPI